MNKCVFITPVGPGHERQLNDCRLSVENAVKFSKGSFTDVEHVVIPDLEGRLGRSRARNIGVERARLASCSWVFFLDADDLLVENALEIAEPFIKTYDAIWGMIYELNGKFSEPSIRLNQSSFENNYSSLLVCDPVLSLQIGHFARIDVVEKCLFDRDLNAGEDFDYYCRMWKRFRCIKVDRPLFINRRGYSSRGPRSASAGEWRKNVTAILDSERRAYS